MTAEEVRDEIINWIKYYPPTWHPADSLKGTIIGIINNNLRHDGTTDQANVRRRMFLAWVFRDLIGRAISEISTKQLNDEMWWALFRYIDPHKDQENKSWIGKDGLCDDLYQCWQAMEKWEHEMNQQLNFFEV